MESQIKKMFDETYSSHFEFVYTHESNFQFLDVLDYLMEAANSINTKEDLSYYENEWLKIEQKIIKTCDSKDYIALFSKVNEIDKHLLSLGEDNDLLQKQSGFKKFFEKKYKELYNNSLLKKQESVQSDQQWSEACRRGEALGINPWLLLE